MKIVNEMNLNFESRSYNESFARSAVSAFVLCLDPTIAELSDIKTAVSEAVTNCIVHAYPDTIGTIYINVRITDQLWNRCIQHQVMNVLDWGLQ